MAGPQRASIDDTWPSRQRTLKRAAQDVLQAPSAKFPRSVKPSSINDILRQHPRERLYVQPLHWTGRHLELLSCVFTSRNRVSDQQLARRTNDRNKVAKDQKLSRSVALAADCLGSGCRSETKAGAMWDVLHDHGFHKLRDSDLSFTFDELPVCYLSTDGVFATSTTAQATLAFLNLDTVAKRRDNSIARPPSNRINSPVVHLRRKKLARLQPDDVTRDPYIAAVLIALAQGQWRPNTSLQNLCKLLTPISSSLETRKPPWESPSFKVFLLATATQNLYLYTADIPLTFLERLNKPSTQSHAEPVPLCYYRIPPRMLSRTIKNIAGLKDRTMHE